MGIKNNLIAYMIVAGCACMMVNFVPDGAPAGVISLAMIGRLYCAFFFRTNTGVFPCTFKKKEVKDQTNLSFVHSKIYYGCNKCINSNVHGSTISDNDENVSGWRREFSGRLCSNYCTVLVVTGRFFLFS